MRRIAILAEGSFEWHQAKTAIGVIRYGTDTIVAVIDSTQAGQDVAHALRSDLGRGIPIVRDIHQALEYQPDALLLGIAPRGGLLPLEWCWQLLTAIQAKLDIINGLHMFLSEDEELRAAAIEHKVTLWDVRCPPQQETRCHFHTSSVGQPRSPLRRLGLCDRKNVNSIRAEPGSSEAWTEQQFEM